ncbi:MAG: hypothetical protein DRJ03_28815 [Chloroflexi bacterium]|nr:MAG: hypothetical protein B6I35_12290 [Anaerolineaceae bacterium 4572_32.2]RLC71388.1 MAG: hypothetical protein DRI81_17810 [Chloroflexota bacterium]RLC76372.1 MAG: hypothetical protein DRJ03_28815 [Chloroflexota bacterium]
MRDPSFWSVTVPRVLGTYAIVIFATLWVGFAIALVVNREWLDLLWNWVQALPLVAQIIVWVLFLPITVGLWIWESSWPALVRLLAFAGIVAWNLLAVSSFLRAVR